MIRASTALAIALATPLSPPAVAATSCHAAPSGTLVSAPNGVRINVRTVGRGNPVILIPSHGRGSSDFDDLAARLARQGFMSILPEPRGINGSSGPAPATLFDMGDDIASVARALCNGPVDVVGHAFGNRVSRAFATNHRAMVAQVVLLAGGGDVPMAPPVMAALEGAMAQGKRPDAERLRDLRRAFFAKGQNAAVWLTGWYPALAATEMAVVRATPAKSWWNAGGAPLLLVQGVEDPIAPIGNADALRRAVGDKLTVVHLRHASHAMLPEQPAAIARVIASYLAHTPRRPASALQRLVDTATINPRRGGRDARHVNEVKSSGQIGHGQAPET